MRPPLDASASRTRPSGRPSSADLSVRSSARTSARHGAAVAVAVLSVLGLAACTSSSSDPSGPASAAATASADAGPRTTYPVDLDNCGTKVSFEAAPTRVVTIKSSTTEMMLALGLGSKIVGTAFLDGPIPKDLVSQANRAVASPLSDKVPGSEAVLALQPDLVYAGWESNVTAQGAGDRSTLAKLGVSTYVSPSACQEKGYQPEPLTYDDVFGEIQEVGKIFDVQGRAASLVAKQKKELAAITPDTRGLTALWWSSGTDTPYVGGDIGAPAMIMKKVGLTNVAAGVHATWTPFTWESVVDADPDVIVLVDASWNTAQHKIEFLEQNGATKNLTAVKNKRFLIVPFASTEAGVRNVEATSDLAADVAKLDLP